MKRFKTFQILDGLFTGCHIKELSSCTAWHSASFPFTHSGAMFAGMACISLPWPSAGPINSQRSHSLLCSCKQEALRSVHTVEVVSGTILKSSHGCLFFFFSVRFSVNIETCEKLATFQISLQPILLNFVAIGLLQKNFSFTSIYTVL